jgi:2-polyprenyl-3-methyl-5-hydroxy-6-metoxy-1,4-benzoquinol methylase
MSPNTKMINNFTCTNCPPYQILSLIYDDIMHHVEYQRWAEYIQRIINEHNPGLLNIIDIGCGTGKLAFELHKLGFNVDGCDVSSEMLEIARRRNYRGSYIQCSLPELEGIDEEKYNICLSLYDTINYLPELQIVINSFNRIYNLLLPGSIFIFDAVSEALCKQYFNEIQESEVINDQYAYSRRSYYISKNSRQINEFTIFTPDGIFEERHIQTIFSFKDLEKAICTKTKFRLEFIYDEFTFNTIEKQSNRAHFVLKKEL